MESLLKLGLSEKKATETLKNEKLSNRLILAADKIPDGSTDLGALTYNLVTKSKNDNQVERILPLIISRKIEMNSQVDAGLKFLLKNEKPETNELEAAVGVGKIATMEDIRKSVSEVVATNSESLKTQRYNFPIGKLLGSLRSHPALLFSDGKAVKDELDAQILNLLGPKTDADSAKPKKAPKQPKVENKDEEKAESYSSIEELIKGAAAKFHKPGANQETERYVTTKHTSRLIKEHLKRTGGIVKTRFPPEPNGILHIGHAKAINFNFGYARATNGTCNLRFDDTNPEKEEERFFRGIQENISWLGYKPDKILHASDYFDQLYEWAVFLIKEDLAYCCHQKADELKGQNKEHSPWRNRPIEESLKIFDEMRRGMWEEGEVTLRVKHVMEDGKKDFVAYRIKYCHHAKTGDKWCIYPTYDFTHCLCDSIEDITHSLCTKEFEARRSSYYWLCNAVQTYCPVQWEYGRLNLQYAVVSKRKIQALIDTGAVKDWDDPRLFTLAALRRRGIPADAIHLFTARIGVTMSQVMLEPAALDACVREVLNTTAPRVMAICDPLELKISNWKELGLEESIEVNEFPEDERSRKRKIGASDEIYIEKSDWQEKLTKGYDLI